MMADKGEEEGCSGVTVQRTRSGRASRRPSGFHFSIMIDTVNPIPLEQAKASLNANNFFASELL
jgi:hypothetical protein